MPDEEISALVCLAVDDRLPNDPTSTRGHFCTRCNREVWMSELAEDFGRANPDIVIICGQCSIELSEEYDELEINALPGDHFGQAVVEQMPDIIREIYGDDAK